MRIEKPKLNFPVGSVIFFEDIYPNGVRVADNMAIHLFDDPRTVYNEVVAKSDYWFVEPGYFNDLVVNLSSPVALQIFDSWKFSKPEPRAILVKSPAGMI